MAVIRKTRLGIALLIAFAVTSGVIVGWEVRAVRNRETRDPQTRAVSAEIEASPFQSVKTANGEAFDRVLIRNVGTVPFEEIFDLLRAAPPEVRFQWVQQLSDMPQGPQRSAAISSFYKTYVQLDPRGAAASIKLMHDKNALWLAADSIIAAAPTSAMPDIALMLTGLSPDMFYGGPDRFDEVIDNWSRVDPVAAAKFVEEHQTFSAASLLRNWAEIDSDAAMAWFQRQPHTDRSDNDLRSLVFGWFQKDKAAAVAFTIAYKEQSDYDELKIEMAQTLFFDSPTEAREFLLQLPRESRSQAISRIVSSSTGVLIGAGPDADTWSRKPRAVAEWVLTLSEDSRSDAMEELMSNWMRADPSEAVQWLDRLPAQTRDQTIAAYARSSNGEDHSEAIALAMTISNTVLRESTLRAHLKNWLPESHDEAIKTLSESMLSEAQKKYLARLLPTPSAHNAR